MSDQEYSLHKERSKVLKSIQEFQEASPEEIENGKSLYRQYLDRYNSIMDDIGSSQPRFDPLVKLPLELWTDILFETLSKEFPDPVYSPIDFYSLSCFLPLLLVSKNWHACIMTAPKLWSEIKLCDKIIKPKNLRAVLVKFLQLSQTRLVTVHIYAISSSLWESINGQLIAHRHRIVKVIVRPQYLYLNDGPFPFYDTKRFSNLTHIDGWNLNTLRLLDMGAPLEEIRGTPITAEILRLPAAKNLRTISTPESVEVIMELARKLPRIKNVNFDPSSSHEPDPLPIQDKKPPPVALGWNSLTWIHTYHTFPLSQLDYLPDLVTLSITWLTVEEVSTLLGKLNRLTRLKEIHFRIKERRDALFQVTWDIQQCPSVERFILNQASLAQDSAGVLLLFTTTIKMFNNLKYLKIIGISSGLSRAYTSLENEALSKLEDLDLEFTSMAMAWTAKLPTSLRRITSNLHSRLVPQLYHPLVETLELYQQYPDDSRIDLTGWPQLLKLTSTDNLFTWNYATNKHLRHITLKSGTNSWRNTLEFIQQLALCPNVLPALESLDLSQVPDWDIFFIMLERRNIFADLTISRIRRVKLPWRCPPSLRLPIKELLGGRLVKRPSNYELSIQGNLERILDRYM